MESLLPLAEELLGALSADSLNRPLVQGLMRVGFDTKEIARLLKRTEAEVYNTLPSEHRDNEKRQHD